MLTKYGMNWLVLSSSSNLPLQLIKEFFFFSFYFFFFIKCKSLYLIIIKIGRLFDLVYIVGITCFHVSMMIFHYDRITPIYLKQRSNVLLPFDNEELISLGDESNLLTIIIIIIIIIFPWNYWIIRDPATSLIPLVAL